MKLEKPVEDLIFNSAKTAHAVGIDTFVIDENGIRGRTEEGSVVILNPTFDISVPFEGIGVGDIAQLVQRYNIHNGNEPKSIEVELDVTGTEVKLITMKSRNLKLEFRCMKASRVKAPKKFNDNEVCTFQLNDDVIDMIKKGSVTMKAPDVMFVKKSNEKPITMVIRDINKSELTYSLEGIVDVVSEPCSFEHSYPVKELLSALKDCDDGLATVGEQASLTILKNGINIIIPARQ